MLSLHAFRSGGSHKPVPPDVAEKREFRDLFPGAVPFGERAERREFCTTVRLIDRPRVVESWTPRVAEILLGAPHVVDGDLGYRNAVVEYASTRFGGVGRVWRYGTPAPPDVSRWLPAIVEPIIHAELTRSDARGRLSWRQPSQDLEMLLPVIALAADEPGVTILLPPPAQDSSQPWRELRVRRALRCVSVFVVDALGRHACAREAFASDARLSLADLTPIVDVDDKRSLAASNAHLDDDQQRVGGARERLLLQRPQSKPTTRTPALTAALAKIVSRSLSVRMPVAL